MKTKTFLPQAALLAGILIPSNLRALEVHEWGTFTVLSTSKGGEVNWYQPFSDISQLPPFTYNPMAMKQRITAARTRMETPVLYFYPEKEMTVHARVAFRNGTITERFPAPSNAAYPSGGLLTGALGNVLVDVSCTVTTPTSDQIFSRRLAEFSSLSAPAVTYWTGDLLPPDHADSRHMPKVTGTAGAHYAAARAVPDAWLFRAASDNPSAANRSIPQVEKFIFYRGAGQEVPPYHADMTDGNTVRFTNNSQSANTFLIAVQVRDGKATWKQMPNISGPGEKSDRTSTLTFPGESMPLEQAEKELSACFLTELISRGLTQAEAQAMIDTWNDTWFTEPGQRIFTIVDRTWVDSVLPLAISPEPKQIERVFVARYEILSPETELKLSRLLDEPASEQRTRDFAALKLGRFGNGAAEVVAEMKKSQVLSQFHQLQTEASPTAGR